MKKLTFLHTSPVHIDTFNALLQELNSPVDVEHIVAEELLDKAREGGITPTLENDVRQQVLDATNRGADIVLCTCSSIGGCAEAADRDASSMVMRVDRAMAEKAVSIGPNIVVAATLASTVEPTLDLIYDAAQKADVAVDIRPVVFESAWACFEAGDQVGYINEIVHGLSNASDNADVIVLAQGSMAQAANRCQDVDVPILSSPKLGLQAALAALED